MTTIQQKIVPHLWYDQEAREAAEFYASIFPDSAVTHVTTLHDTPSGDCDVVSFELWGQKFKAISAGPLFQFNPAVSFIVNFDPLFFDPSPTGEEAARAKLDEIWEKFSADGTVLMPLDEYPFSRRYGWIQDRYGVSWQLILTDPEGEPRPPIVPSLMFVGENYGKAEEAINFYLSVFKHQYLRKLLRGAGFLACRQPGKAAPRAQFPGTEHSRLGALMRYGAGQEPNKKGTVMFADFVLENCWFAAIDSAFEHAFTFNEAISFMVYCEDQEEIDDYWEKLSAVPEAEQCGWLKDRYGLSWQIVPTVLDEMMRSGTQEQLARVTQAFLQMKKFDLAALQRAYERE